MRHLVLLAGFAACTAACRDEPHVADGPPHPFEAGATAAEPVELVIVAGAATPAAAGDRDFDVARRTDEAVRGHSRRISATTFDIALRSARLVSYPCTSCHLGGRFVGEQRVGDAHAEVQPVHPAESGAACATCHDPADVERLRLRGGETTTLDRADRLCAQCHFTQVADWAGGAHGKRLDGWRGRRVVMGCADCHDPHRPTIEKRVPYPGPLAPPRRE